MYEGCFPHAPSQRWSAAARSEKVFILPVRAVRLCVMPCAVWAGGERGAVRVLCGCRER